MKLQILQIVSIIIALFLCMNSNAQTGIDFKLKKLFFGLNIDSCQTKIEKEIENSTFYKFKYAGKIDTIGTGNSMFYFKRLSFAPCYKLENNEQSLANCDSTFILLQPVFVSRGASHGKVDYEKLYRHRVSIYMHFSDSSKAYATYKNLADSIANYLDKGYSSGCFTIDNNEMGNITTINIDEKNNGYEYNRDVEISIRRYEKSYSLEIDFVKHTIKPENCKRE